MTTHVISGTVTAVVIANLGTSANSSRSGSRARTTPVISGVIVIQVRSAILYGGGGGGPWSGRQCEPALKAGEVPSPHRPDGMRLGAL
jgi:hypothetical protein